MGHPGGGDAPPKWGTDIEDSARILGARLDTDAPMMNTSPEEIKETEDQLDPVASLPVLCCSQKIYFLS